MDQASSEAAPRKIRGRRGMEKEELIILTFDADEKLLKILLRK